MTATQLLMTFYDSSWQHEWESVNAALAGLAPEEAAWQPPGYPASDSHGGSLLPGTVLWQMAHLEHCVRHYTAILHSWPVTEEPDTPPPPGRTLPELSAALEDARRMMREAIASVSDAGLEMPCVRTMNVAEFITMAIRHNCWHAGQIVVARRQYRQHAGTQ